MRLDLGTLIKTVALLSSGKLGKVEVENINLSSELSSELSSIL